MNKSAVETYLRLIATPALPDIGPTPRPGTLAPAALEEKLAGFLTGEHGKPLLAAALLWHDHLDESHGISQGLHDQSGSFLHGIMHRREPDYGNAKYWFRHVGLHPAFPHIANRVEALQSVEAAECKILTGLVRRGTWQPDAFVDACEKAAPSTGAERELLKRVQAIEFEELVKCLCPA